MYTCEINDHELQKFLRESPKRAEWALKEALKAAGYKLRKAMKKHIEAAAGWAALAKSTIEKKRSYARAGKFRTSPLEIFSRLVKMKYSKTKKSGSQVKIGFFNTKSWFKAFYGPGAATIAELHETGKKSGRYGSRPLRQMIAPVWRKEGGRIFAYVKKKFFEVFFSNKKRGLKY